VIFPEKCPCCGSLLVEEVNPKDPRKVAYRCPNGMGCSVQVQGALEHFGSRRALDIEGLGPKILEQLVATGRVGKPSDLYDLTVGDLSGLERMGDKSARNLVDAIACTRERSAERVLFALGIRHVGEATARELLSAFGSIESLARAERTALLDVDHVSDVLADSVQEWFGTEINVTELDRLMKAGLQSTSWWRAPRPGQNSPRLRRLGCLFSTRQGCSACWGENERCLDPSPAWSGTIRCCFCRPASGGLPGISFSQEFHVPES